MKKLSEIVRDFVSPGASPQRSAPVVAQQKKPPRVINGMGDLLRLLHEQDVRIKQLEDEMQLIRGHLNI
jgi:hypothetical protein